jgi:phosphoserine phosphatase RsbU/P
MLLDFIRHSPRIVRTVYLFAAAVVFCLAGYSFLTVMVWRTVSNDQCEWVDEFTDSTRIYIDSVAPGSEAERAGLTSGDIVLLLNGRVFRTSDDVIAYAQTLPPGTVSLRVERDQRPIELTLVKRAGRKLGMRMYDRYGMRLTITRIVPGGVADRAGLRDGDVLLRIDGVSVLTRSGPMPLINRHEAGTEAVYLVDRAGQRLELPVTILKTVNIVFLAQFLLGLGIALVGLVVVLVRPDRIQRRFARYGLLSLLFFASLAMEVISQSSDDALWKMRAFGTAYLFAIAVASPAFVSFFMHFPVRKSVADRRWVRAFITLVPILASAFIAARYFGLLKMSALPVIAFLAGMIPYIFLLTGFVLFAHSYFHLPDLRQRRQLRPVLIAVVTATLTVLYLVVIRRVYPLAIFLDPWLLTPAVLIVGIPPAFGYSIVKHRLMDVTLIVKRSLIYGAITMAVAMLYLLLVFGLGRLIGWYLGQTDNTLVNVIAFVVIALLFDPLKRRVQAVVDRVFYQERTAYHQALLEFSRELPRQIDLDGILHSLISRVSGAMHIEAMAVSLCDTAEGCHVVAQHFPADMLGLSDCRDGALSVLRESRAPLSLVAPDEDLASRLPADELARYRTAGVELFVPMMIQDRLIGAIIVGAKRSGKLYSREDIELLSTVGSQAAIALENARLHRSEIEKQKLDEQMAMARRIQTGLLPRSTPAGHGLDISGVSLPALTVGGDYFDYITLPGGRLLVVVGDVAGKGMSAALYMSQVQGLIRFAAHMHDSPKDMLIDVNRHVYEGIERNSFITLVLALFDSVRNTVTICRAGHTPPLLARDGSLFYVETEGMGLGLDSGALFAQSLEEQRLPLDGGELFVLYSDGLTEAMNEAHREFGEDRLATLVRAHRGEPAEDLQRRLIDAVEEHRGSAEQHDDITLVVVKVDARA